MICKNFKWHRKMRRVKFLITVVNILIIVSSDSLVLSNTQWTLAMLTVSCETAALCGCHQLPVAG